MTTFDDPAIDKQIELERFWKKLGLTFQDDYCIQSWKLPEYMHIGNLIGLCCTSEGHPDPASPRVPLEVLIEGWWHCYDKLTDWTTQMHALQVYHKAFANRIGNACRTALIAAIQAIPEGSGIKTTR